MSALRSAVALVLGILLLAYPSLPASGSPAAAGPTVLAAGDPAGDPAGPVPASDYVLPRGVDGRAYVRTWPGRRIRYYESIPAKWDWSLSRAVDAWNDSGSKIKFVEVSSRSRAQLTISYGDTRGSDGMATVGQTPGAWVRLSHEYKRARTDPHTRVWVGRLFAHELGHVVGFGHTAGSCSLMVPVFDMGRCALLAPDPAYYVCRWIDRPLLKRFIRMYGGTAHRPPARCLIDPLPAQLTDVTFEGGQTEDRAVTIRWGAPAKFPTGTRVHVRVWQGTQCGAAPRTADLYSSEVDRLSWTDPSLRDGTFCYQAQIVNTLGAGPPAFARAMTAWWRRPDAPVITGVTWDPDRWEFRFRATLPAGARLYSVQDWQEPAACVGTWREADAESMNEELDGSYRLWSNGPEQCLTFFAVAEWGAVSDPVVVTFAIPVPADRR